MAQATCTKCGRLYLRLGKRYEEHIEHCSGDSPSPSSDGRGKKKQKTAHPDDPAKPPMLGPDQSKGAEIAAYFRRKAQLARQKAIEYEEAARKAEEEI